MVSRSHGHGSTSHFLYFTSRADDVQAEVAVNTVPYHTLQLRVRSPSLNLGCDPVNRVLPVRRMHLHLIRLGEVRTAGLKYRSILATKLTTSERCNQSLLLEGASGVLLNNEVEEGSHSRRTYKRYTT
eukprot:CCRYP_004466-RC/>CCRYP_004466-RC protein AED:0.48 eAED:0.66 QI:166/0/0.5/1/0/0/2/0/127